jgi:hypothetical protein
MPKLVRPRGRLLPVLKVAIPLLSVQFIPAFVLYFGFGTSMAEGTAVAVFVTLSIFLAGEAVSFRRRGNQPTAAGLRPFVYGALCVLLVVPHSAVSEYFETIDLARLLATAPFLFLLIAAAIALGHLLGEANDSDVNDALNLSFGVLCLALILRAAGLEPHADSYGKAIFPFSETSHFVLAFLPVLLYRCVTSTHRGAFAWLIFGFVIAIGLESMTLLVGCLVTAIVCRRAVLIAMVGLLVGVAVAPFRLDYFISRVALSDTTDNLSTLVYVQGWQLLIEAINQTYGWGVGFEQLGRRGTTVAAADTIATVLFGSGVDALNLTDGGFVFAKLVGEMGIFGFLLTVLFVAGAIRSIRVLRRREAVAREPPLVLFSRCVLVSYIVDMFVRGTGYFVGSTFLVITACSILLKGQGTAIFPAIAAALRSSKTKPAERWAR